MFGRHLEIWGFVVDGARSARCPVRPFGLIIGIVVVKQEKLMTITKIMDTC
jgi:hypothetical protein